MNNIKILVMYANEYDVDGNKGTTINYFFFHRYRCSLCKKSFKNFQINKNSHNRGDCFRHWKT